MTVLSNMLTTVRSAANLQQITITTCPFLGTSFTVQWEEVSLQDKPNDGKFTFQVTLVNNGDIVFVYKKIPLIIEAIQDDQHPVKVGLSDAYIIDRTIFCKLTFALRCIE